MVAARYVRLPNVMCYEVRCTSPLGVVVGYSFHSPLVCKVDPYYCLFYRKQFDAIYALSNGLKAKKKYDLGNIMTYFLEDDAILITKKENNAVVSMLEAV